MGKGKGWELKARTHTATFITLVSTRGSPEQGGGAPKPRDEGPFSTPKPRAFISTPTKHSCGPLLFFPHPEHRRVPSPHSREWVAPDFTPCPPQSGLPAHFWGHAQKTYDQDTAIFWALVTEMTPGVAR